jgi:hypothetical protein
VALAKKLQNPVADLITALILMRVRPAGVSSTEVGAGLVLLLTIRVSSCLLQVPQHTVLLSGFNREAHLRLVRTNWIRTVAWSIRGLRVLYMLRM